MIISVFCWTLDHEYANLSVCETPIMDKKAEIQLNQDKINNYEREIVSLEDEIFSLDHKTAELLLEQTKIRKKFEYALKNVVLELRQHEFELANSKEVYPEDKDMAKQFLKLIRQREMDKIEIQKNMDDEIFETISKIEEIKLRKELFVSQMNRLIDKKNSISKEIFEISKLPSYHVKFTLNHEENAILEELVKEKGSNKAAVVRQVLVEYKSLLLKIDELSLRLENESMKNKLENDSLKDRYEVEIKNKNETIKALKDMRLDIFEFEENLENFKNTMKSNVSFAGKKFNEAISDIDNSISQLEKTKANLMSSQTHLDMANKKSSSIRIPNVIKEEES